MDLMHGEIKLESEIGQGTKTTFWVFFRRAHVDIADLPFVDFRPDPIRSAARLSHYSASGHGSGKQSAHSDVAPVYPVENTPDTSQQLCKSKAGDIDDMSFDHGLAPKIFAEDEFHLSQSERRNIHILVVEDK